MNDTQLLEAMMRYSWRVFRPSIDRWHCVDWFDVCLGIGNTPREAIANAVMQHESRVSMRECLDA